MRKEKLTIENIQADLHKEIKNGYFRLVEFSVLLILFIGVFIAVYHVVLFEALLLRLVLIVGIGVFLFLLIVQIANLMKLHKSYKDPGCVIKDKLVSIEMRHSLGHRYEHPFLRFSSYGEYKIPEDNYTWSAIFSMPRKGVCNHSACGDEFYLVLSKPHTGKILYAYNTKMFELE